MANFDLLQNEVDDVVTAPADSGKPLISIEVRPTDDLDWNYPGAAADGAGGWHVSFTRITETQDTDARYGRAAINGSQTALARLDTDEMPPHCRQSWFATHSRSGEQ